MGYANFKKAYESCDFLALATVRGWGNRKILFTYDGALKIRVFSVTSKRGVLRYRTYCGKNSIRRYPDHVDYESGAVTLEEDGWLNRLMTVKMRRETLEQRLALVGQTIAVVSKQSEELDWEGFQLPRQIKVRIAEDASWIGWNGLGCAGQVEFVQSDEVHTVYFT